MPVSIMIAPAANGICWTKNSINFAFGFSGIAAGWKLQMELLDSVTGTVIGAVVVPFPGSSGNMVYDVRALCDPYPGVAYPIYLTSANSETTQAVPEQVKYVILKYTIVGNGAPTAAAFSSSFYILKGGKGEMSLFDSPTNLFGLSQMDRFLPYGSKWLTWIPTGRYMSRKEYGWLLYLSGTAEIQFVRYTVRYLNNTQATFNRALSGSGATNNLHKLWLVPIGVEQAKLDPGNLGVDWVDVVVMWGAVVMSHVYRINCDNRPYYDTKTVYYRNSLGGIDHIDLKGEVESKMTSDKQVAQIGDDQPYFFGRTRASWKGHTGWISKGHMKALSFELANARDCFMVHGGAKLPVRIPPQSVAWTNKDMLWSAGIEIEAPEQEIMPHQLTTL